MLLNRRAFGALSVGALAAAAMPKRRWTIYVVQHSHIDNGFTERQEVVAEYHAQFVKQAVDLAHSPKQRERNAETRFKFTIEGFWAVEQFWKRASSDEKRQLIESLHAGDLELSASYFNLIDIADENLLRRSVQFAADFSKAHDVPLNVAMCCDVNGVSAGLAQAFVEAGVKRLSTNINPDQGGYPFGKPLVPFFWRMPDKQRMLVWNGLAYHKANLFGLMGGSVPAGDPGIPGLILPGMSGYVNVTDTSVAESKLLPFLTWLEQSGYPYDFLPLMGSGTYTDNSPPGDAYCTIMKQWNTKLGATVQVRTATLREFFDRLEQESSKLPEYSGDWPNWWDDDAATAPNATALYRNAVRQRDLISLMNREKKIVSPTELDDIDRDLLAYAEHTFGYSRTAAPTLLGEQVFERKEAYAVSADAKASAAVDRLLEACGNGEFTADQRFEYKVLNPSAWQMDEIVGLSIRFFEAPFLQSGIRVLDHHGEALPFQVEQSPRGWNVYVRTRLAPQQTATYKIVSGAPQTAAKDAAADTFSNRFYKLSWSASAGVTSYLVNGAEWLDASRGGLGCPVYQIFPGANRSEAGAVSGKRTRPHDEVTYGQCKSVRRTESGPISESYRFEYSIPGCYSYAVTLRCYRDLPHFDISAQFVKTEVDDPEGLYIYFPFQVPQSRWMLDKPGGAMRPGMDQLPGTCCDYYTVLSGAAQVAEAGGVAWVTLDAPLVQIGGLKLWNFSTETDGKGPLYSWITNNKWQTNTRYRCGGAYEMRYRVTAISDPRDAIRRTRELSALPIAMRT